MTQRLQGKVALVTAAGQGIGRAIAEAFAAEGSSVIATDVDESKLVGSRSAKRLKLDARSTASVEALAEQLAGEDGALDVLVNCAGYVHHGSVHECSEEDWDFSFDLNVKSMHRTIRAFLPGMLEKKAGAIVNISSAVSSIRGVPDRYAYGATKAAVIGLTKAVAADFIRHRPRQRDLSGHHRVAFAEGRIGNARRRREDTAEVGLHRAPAHGPPAGPGGRGARRLRLPRGQPTSRAIDRWTAAWRRDDCTPYNKAFSTYRGVSSRHRRPPMRTAAAANPSFPSRNHLNH